MLVFKSYLNLIGNLTTNQKSSFAPKTKPALIGYTSEHRG
jgi:hypothetical protein